ncbi:uncharacterized protein LOC125705171 isoform X2 [Brienomyrus brachyistius]|uniref:uncharacterized protein LOC125705171 isoform X2 n=1 Tax=Brienomyrus brachyistius TaxID=42636 RepID=UPI0020B45E68|nr:uncharacterized protein LOC125705171 isoform X2 [Brienomyrus brachyistius]
MKMLQTRIGHYKKLGVLLLLATVVGNSRGSQNMSSSGPGTATPTATAGHNHSVGWTSPVANTTGLHFNSTTGKDGMSNVTTAAMTTSSLGSKWTSQLMSVATSGGSSRDTWNTTAADRSDKPVKNNIGLGLFILIFLMAVIILLIVVIWCIRKKTRQYSFDLNHKEDVDIPLSSVGQGGVFAPNQNDEKPADFEYVAKEESGVAPGDSELQSAEDSRGPEDDLEKSVTFGSQIALTPKEKPLEFPFNLIDGEANQSSDTATETLGEPQNENNNNTGARLPSSPDSPTAGSFGAGPCGIFTEISLDEPV